MDKFSPYKIAQVPIFCFEFTFCFKSFNKILTQVCGGCGIQLADQSLPTPEDPGSNPVIINFDWTFIYCSLSTGRKDKNKEKDATTNPIGKK